MIRHTKHTHAKKPGTEKERNDRRTKEKKEKRKNEKSGKNGAPASIYILKGTGGSKHDTLLLYSTSTIYFIIQPQCIEMKLAGQPPATMSWFNVCSSL